MCGVWGGSDVYNITVGDTLATETATKISYSNSIYNFGFAGILLMGSNPDNLISNFKVYFNYIHDAKRNNKGDNEYGIFFTANPASSSWPKFATAKYNRIENIRTWHGLDIHGGSYIYLTDNYIYDFGRNGISTGLMSLGSIKPICENIFIERNIIEQPASGWIKEIANSFIFLGGYIEGYQPKNIIIKDNILFYTANPSWGPYPGISINSNVENLIISGNKFYNGGRNGFQAIYFGKFHRKNVTITRNFIASWGLGIILTGGYITDTLNITNNIIHTDKNMALYITDSKIPPGGVCNVLNNIILSEFNVAISIPLGIDKNGYIIAKNNIIGRTITGTMSYWLVNGLNEGTLICNNNIYWNSTSGNPFILNGIAKDWTFWKSKSFDKHGLIGSDPLFINGSGLYELATDFKIKPHSPAINNGTFVGLKYDFLGFQRYFLDIGAIEYRP